MLELSEDWNKSFHSNYCKFRDNVNLGVALPQDEHGNLLVVMSRFADSNALGPFKYLSTTRPISLIMFINKYGSFVFNVASGTCSSSKYVEVFYLVELQIKKGLLICRTKEKRN